MIFLEQYAVDNGFERKNDNEYCGPCPKCKGKDRFIIRPHKYEDKGGFFLCRSCEPAAGQQKGTFFSGDGIQFCRTYLNMSYREACEAVGAGHLLKNRQKEYFPQDKKAADSRRSDVETVVDIVAWRAAASQFLDAATAAMKPGTAIWRYALDRGFTPADIEHYRLGAQPENWTKASRAHWGLGGDGDFYIPRGLVLPSFLPDGRIARLKIRCVNVHFKDGKEFKHYRFKGSVQTHIISQGITGRPLIVVESEIDAVLIHAAAGDVFDVVAMAGATGTLDKFAHAAIRRASLVIDALDNDAGGEKCRALLHGALEEDADEPILLAMPTDKGRVKDPGEYRQKGGDLRAWALSCLPERIRRNVPTEKPVEAAPAMSSRPAAHDDGGKQNVVEVQEAAASSTPDTPPWEEAGPVEAPLVEAAAAAAPIVQLQPAEQNPAAVEAVQDHAGVQEAVTTTAPATSSRETGSQAGKPCACVEAVDVMNIEQVTAVRADWWNIRTEWDLCTGYPRYCLKCSQFLADRAFFCRKFNMFMYGREELPRRQQEQEVTQPKQHR